MTISPAGRKRIEGFEGCVLKAYRDQRGILTIGYGHTGPEVTVGLMWTLAQADAAMTADLVTRVEEPLNRLVSNNVVLSQNMFDALGSLVYNIGEGAFAESTLLRLLNQHDALGAANQFLVWDKTKAATNDGLLDRRIEERKIFMTPDAAAVVG